jgi:hypothetical protein
MVLSPCKELEGLLCRDWYSRRSKVRLWAAKGAVASKGSTTRLRRLPLSGLSSEPQKYDNSVHRHSCKLLGAILVAVQTEVPDAAGADARVTAEVWDAQGSARIQARHPSTSTQQRTCANAMRESCQRCGKSVRPLSTKFHSKTHLSAQGWGVRHHDYYHGQ